MGSTGHGGKRRDPPDGRSHAFFSIDCTRASTIPGQSCGSLLSGRVDGHGTVSNLSLNGCQIQSSCIVRPDTYLTLLLSLPDAPLKIRVAAVRWNRPGGRCGISICRGGDP
jgi:hypothetical protein